MNSYAKDFCFVFIELQKFSKTKEDQLGSVLEKFFKYAAETRESDIEKIQ